MIARPHLPQIPSRRLAGLAPRIRLGARHRLLAAAASLIGRDAQPTRFSPDAWNAWSERGTL